ncbi:MAG TPA: hypothetical protein DCQ64_28480 [Candidatus Rokubacteria bacterium]|nr:hypothetical protein [Candidatus Rokubacteria bacterium]
MKRADILLLLIEERSHGGCYVPCYGEEYIRCLGTREQTYHTQVVGAGDQSALNSLLRRGLIVRVPIIHGYEITEDGRLRAQTLA